VNFSYAACQLQTSRQILNKWVKYFESALEIQGMEEDLGGAPPRT
jgi:hypothetical protein